MPLRPHANTGSALLEFVTRFCECFQKYKGAFIELVHVLNVKGVGGGVLLGMKQKVQFYVQLSTGWRKDEDEWTGDRSERGRTLPS